MNTVRENIDITKIAREGERAWGAGRLRKTRATVDLSRIVEALQAVLRLIDFSTGVLAAYLELALDEGEDSGQSSLDALGVNETFAWASARDFTRDGFAVRGSKIIQSAYGTHVDRLAKLVAVKTNPANPTTIRQLTGEIKKEWSAITKSQATVIARTESAHVWETTNFNALSLNGVEDVDWLIASGPSIGVRVGPVCEQCLALAALSPYEVQRMDEIPPAHPNCRCTLVPILGPEWLPPAEPWTGSERRMAVFT